MSKHRKKTPYWKSPVKVASTALIAGFLVSGAIALPNYNSSSVPSTTTHTDREFAQFSKEEDIPEIEPGEVIPVNTPPARANAKALTEAALRKVILPSTNAVQTDNVETVATAQKTYIATALEYEVKRREAKRLANEAAQKEEEAAELTKQWEAAVAEAERLTVIAEEKRSELGKWAATVYRQGMTSDDTALLTMLSGPKNTEEMFDMHHYMSSVSRSKGNAERQALRAQEEAEGARLEAARVKKEADAAAEASVQLANEAKEAETVSAELSATADAQASELAQQINIEEINSGTFSPISAGQRVLNASAVDHWNSYLNEIKTADIILPSSEELQEADVYLPEGLEPVLGVDGEALDGVAVHAESGLTVLPQDVIVKVSAALETVGTNYGTENTPAQSCEVMVGSMYDNTSSDLPALWTSGQQQSDLLNVMPGDAVYFADPSSGITQAGIYLGADLVVRASAASGYAEVAKVDASVFGVNRPSVAVQEGEVTPAPEPQEGALQWTCGGIEGNTEVTDAWTLPVSAGSYDLGVKFHDDSSRWGQGVLSEGIEFIAQPNTPVVAVGDGLVTVVDNDPLWGNRVIINHPDGSTSYYSNLAQVTAVHGSNITAGTVLGTVGQTGSSANQEKTSVFVQVAFGEVFVDPQILFFSASASGSAADAVGKVPAPDGGSVEINALGHKNGMLPDDVLCSINEGGHRLRCDAARAYIVLAAAYKAHFGTDLVITDSYRTYASQVAVKRAKPDLAATPGTSKHGWGLAVDLGGGINEFNTPQYNWMKENAEKYGFHHPDWAEPNGSMPEAWHWEYISTKKK